MHAISLSASRRKAAGTRGRDDAHVLRVVPRLAGGRGAPARPVVERCPRRYDRVGARELVRAASAEARAAGVTRGMRRREAEAQCPDAVCVDADDALEARTFEIVARAIETLTPRVVLDRPGRCAFTTRALALLRRRRCARRARGAAVAVASRCGDTMCRPKR